MPIKSSTGSTSLKTKKVRLSGDHDEWHYIWQGQNLTSQEINIKESALRSTPNDLASRLMLLGFYGQSEHEWKRYFHHMYWMIDNCPERDICRYLGHSYNSRFVEWTKSRVQRTSQKWSNQVKKNSGEATVLCNAADFFSRYDHQISERLYRQAKRANPKLALPARQLAYDYRYQATLLSSKDRPRLIRMALKEVDYALERRDHRGERIGLRKEFASTAIRFGHFEQARTYAIRLKYYGQEFHLWWQYAQIYLAWLDFKEARKRALNHRLKELATEFGACPSHAASCRAALWFVQDVLDAKQEELALKILEILATGEEKYDEKVELVGWAEAIRTGRQPKFKLLQFDQDRVF